MSLENDAFQRERIRRYWDERLKREAEEAREQSRLKIIEGKDPWFIRLLDWLARKMDGVT